MVLRPDQFTENAREVLGASQELVRRLRHTQWDAEHVVYSLLEEREGVPAEIFSQLGIVADQVKSELLAYLESAPKAAYESGQIYVTPRATRFLENAKGEADRLKDEFVGTEHLLVAATMERQGETARLFKEHGIDQEKVYQALVKIRGGQRVTDPRAESKYRSLERYSIDLTKLAQEDKLDPVIGREEEVKRVMQTLTRRTKNNPVLIGEVGVGKNGYRGGSGPEDRRRRRARRPQRPPRADPGHGRPRRRQQVSRGVRGAPQGGDGRGKALSWRGHPVHRRDAHGGGRRSRPRAASTPVTS